MLSISLSDAPVSGLVKQFLVQAILEFCTIFSPRLQRRVGRCAIIINNENHTRHHDASRKLDYHSDSHAVGLAVG